MDELELKTYPESCLRIKTNPVKSFENNLPQTLKTMADIMHVNSGIGLAATQVGIETSFLIVDVGEGLEPFVNPEIVSQSRKKIRMEEGCLSLPGIAVDVPRPEWITIKAQNQNGDIFVREYTGLMARVILHEIDHLNGKLIIDYMNPFKRFMAVRKLSGNKRKAKKC